MNHVHIDLKDAPKIPGLRVRQFAGESDHPAMAAMMNQIALADGGAADFTPANLANWDQCIEHFDPPNDRIMVEIDGRMIGAGRVQSAKTVENERLYFHSTNLVHEFRGKGMERPLLRHLQRRLRDIAKTHPEDAPRFFQAFGIKDDNLAMIEVLTEDGYTPIRHSFEMVRPNLDDIPEARLPDGIEVRPIREEQLRTIWEAREEAFLDHWGKVPATEQAFAAWCKIPDWNRELTRVAWAGDQCVGMVMIFVPEEHNKTHERQRAYTESICVRRPWRKQGVASALIVQCLHALREAGFHEAALGVDTENLSGALRIYEILGYRAVARYSSYRRVMT
jgi:ribosomal protein S18 acetylase RimI-like enzyme